MKFHLLNVFTKDGKNGNQLAAVFPDQMLEAEEMQAIAKDFDFSETIFIWGARLRIFTPNAELPFAGHPTVGATWLLHQLEVKSGHFTLHVPLGDLEVESSRNEAFVTFPGDPSIRDFTGDLKLLFRHCNINPNDVSGLIKNVSAGPEFTIVPLFSRESLSNAKSPVESPARVKAYFYYRENKHTFHARMFAPNLSVNEDAATGAAACALAAYLRSLGEESGDVVIIQGADMQRESEIKLRWNKDRIQIGGKVKRWGEGELL